MGKIKTNARTQEDADTGARIRAMRNKRGLTQVQLAADLGVARASISKMESGEDLPGRDLVKEIAAYFGVTTDFLLNGTTDDDGGPRTLAALLDYAKRLAAQTGDVNAPQRVDPDSQTAIIALWGALLPAAREVVIDIMYRELTGQIAVLRNASAGSGITEKPRKAPTTGKKRTRAKGRD